MLDPRIDKIRQTYGLEKDDFWKLPQGRDVWLVKHAALEAVAAKAGIEFEEPQIIEADGANGVAALYVRGHLDKKSVWSTGEANPKNCRNAYPWAIAEKRAIDRVILKLVGLHGLVYSEEESDDFKRNGNGAEPETPKRQVGWRDDGTRTPHALRKEGAWEEFMSEISEVTTMPGLKKFALGWSAKVEKDNWPDTWKELAREEIEKHKQAIKSGEIAPPDEDTFPGDLPSHPIMAG